MWNRDVTCNSKLSTYVHALTRTHTHTHTLQQQVEWQYALDIHANAFFCSFLLTHILQVILLPVCVLAPYLLHHLSLSFPFVRRFLPFFFTLSSFISFLSPILFSAFFSFTHHFFFFFFLFFSSIISSPFVLSIKSLILFLYSISLCLLLFNSILIFILILKYFSPDDNIINIIFLYFSIFFFLCCLTVWFYRALCPTPCMPWLPYGMLISPISAIEVRQIYFLQFYCVCFFLT